MNTLSTSALAKKLNSSSKELFSHFTKLGWIERANESWELTDQGKSQGGSYKESKQYGRYIVWPESIELNGSSPADSPAKKINATAIGKHFDISARRVNFILSELGWVRKDLKGWRATDQGIKKGAQQSEDQKSGIPFVRWPDTILSSSALTETMAEATGTAAPSAPTSKPSQDQGFREKFPAKHRTTDGHMVRSKAEMLIDNWLYMAEIVHAYERKLPIEEDVYCDFYIPTGKVYIEYWGYENEPKYLARKEQKLAIYQKYGFNLIELSEQEVQNLDDILPRLLLKFGVQAY